MTTTTTVRETTAHRRGKAGLLGGALWALLPVAWALVSIEEVEFGTAAWFGVVASYWIVAVLPPVLMIVGLGALRRELGNDVGRVGRIGMAVHGVGLGAMSLGLGIEIASMTAGGGEVAIGHAIFLIGFLVTVVGALLLGIALVRSRRNGLVRAAGLLLALAFPLGIGIGMLGSLLGPGNDAWFFAAIAVPTGVAWFLLGRALAAYRPAPVDELAPAA